MASQFIDADVKFSIYVIDFFFFLKTESINERASRKSINTQKSITKEPPTSSRKSIKTQNRKRKITNALFAQQQRKTTSIENKKKEKKCKGTSHQKNWVIDFIQVQELKALALVVR